jgi:hypothetical protein
MKGITYYSDEILGNRENYNQPVTFDKTDEYLGISQKGKDNTVERVLLTPRQVKEMLAFLKSRKNSK